MHHDALEFPDGRIVLLTRLVPGQRATVLSFKGLAFNLGYGFNSLLFALLLQAFRDCTNPEQALAQGLRFLPPWLIFTLLVLGIAFWRRRAVLRQKY